MTDKGGCMEKKEINGILFKKITIAFLAIVGILATIKLAIIYYEANFNPYSLPSFCSINEFIDCDGIAQTTHSQFFGIPLAYWGMGLYIFILFLLVSDKLKQVRFLRFLRVFKHPLSYISALGFVSFVISMVLAFISIFEIKKICVLCVFTYFLNLCMAMIATNWYYEKGKRYPLSRLFLAIYKSFKISFKDFWHAIKIRKYFFAFGALMLISASVLVYTSVSYCFAPQVKRANEFKKYVKMQEDNPFRVSGNVLGDENAPMTVYIYTDYKCPICRTYNVIVSRAAQEVGGFKMVHKNLPLDMECNSNLRRPFHEGSCLLAKYAIAAKNQGMFWDMNSELFEKQPKTEEDVLTLAETMGLDVKKLQADANSDQTMNEIQSDIQDAIDLRIDGTPTIVINGKVYSGIKPYYELRDLLIGAGAVEKR